MVTKQQQQQQQQTKTKTEPSALVITEYYITCSQYPAERIANPWKKERFDFVKQYHTNDRIVFEIEI